MQSKLNCAGDVYFARNLKIIEHPRYDITPSGGTILVISDDGTVAHHDVPSGAILKTRNGQSVSPGVRLFEYDPATVPLVAEVEGTVTLIDCIEGVSIARRVDEITGLTTLVVIKDKRAKNIVKTKSWRDTHELHPRIVINRSATWSLCTPQLPPGTQIYTEWLRNAKVVAGDIIARIPV